MPKLEIPPNEALYPVPVVLVSCRDEKNARGNIVTIAWCGIVASNPPQISVSIRPGRHSHSLIMSEREFAINVPTEDIVRQVDACGVISGKGFDKAAAFSLNFLPASRISAPLVKECPVNIECSLVDVVRLGSHDAFIGRVLAVHADSEVVGKDGKIDYGITRPFVYNQGEYWSLGRKIGRYGFSSK